MLIVKIDDPKSIDRALKILKGKVSRTGIIKELKERQEYKKPSVIRRQKKLNAIYKEKFKNKNNDEEV